MDSQGEDTCRDGPPAPHCALPTGWRLFPASRRRALDGSPGPVCRSLLLCSPRQRWCWSVFIRDHRALYSQVRVPHSLPDLFDSPGCHPTRQRDVNMKHTLPSPMAPHKGSKDKTGPKDLTVLRMGAWQGRVLVSKPAGAGVGEGVLAQPSAQDLGS